MKYICQHEETEKYLKKWPGTKTLLIATFFFWKPGRTLQKSLRGLVRGIIHSILSQSAELIPLLFPKHWNTAFSGVRPVIDEDDEVLAAFRKLSDLDSIYATSKIAVFIDGLDEFEGDLPQMIKILKAWVSARLPDVKICVSSREEIELQEAFKMNKQINVVICDGTPVIVHILAALSGMFWYFNFKGAMIDLTKHLPLEFVLLATTLVWYPLKVHGFLDVVAGYLEQGISARHLSQYDTELSYWEYFQKHVLMSWCPGWPIPFPLSLRSSRQDGNRISLHQLLGVLVPPKFATVLQEMIDWHLAHEEELTAEQLIEVKELFGPKVWPLLTLESIEELHMEGNQQIPNPYSDHGNRTAIPQQLAREVETRFFLAINVTRRSSMPVAREPEGAVVFSTNYFVGQDEISLEDAQGTLKIYDDTKTASGNVAKRHFCSNCGSPIYTTTPSAPGKLYLKAALFDTISSPKLAVFKERQPQWATLTGAEGEI
ncbi:GFA family protein [Aspergillus affinis]|uniref:GFA family protein n=1 Tax=Aspergillus affinis TaxID=1070780 RepID=UPI0022FF1C01|nr:uncharacterized protein KD926_011687 [Aspergillus affinis]KAI9044717.1 hypothetical protein KD926_011687 [Aspergillus affinis]